MCLESTIFTYLHIYYYYHYSVVIQFIIKFIIYLINLLLLFVDHYLSKEKWILSLYFYSLYVVAIL